MDYHSTIKKNDVTMWVDLVGIMLNEINPRERKTPYDFPYMWNLNK